MSEKTIGERFEYLGMILNDSETTLGELQGATADLGLAIQFRIVPFDQTIYTLNIQNESSEGAKV